MSHAKVKGCRVVGRPRIGVPPIARDKEIVFTFLRILFGAHKQHMLTKVSEAWEIDRVLILTDAHRRGAGGHIAGRVFDDEDARAVVKLKGTVALESDRGRNDKRNLLKRHRELRKMLLIL